MFCPKCGSKNPDDGKFCRSCGVDLGNVSDALSGKLVIEQGCGTTRRGRPITIESAATKFFMGLAFLVVSIVLAVTGRGGGWWFWMLIPAFIFVGGGIAQYLQIRRMEQGRTNFSPESERAVRSAPQQSALPSPPANFVSAPESRYKTGDLVPPSVTDGTTKLLELEVDQEGQTRTLPKV